MNIVIKFSTDRLQNKDTCKCVIRYSHIRKPQLPLANSNLRTEYDWTLHAATWSALLNSIATEVDTGMSGSVKRDVLEFDLYCGTLRELLFKNEVWVDSHMTRYGDDPSVDQNCNINRRLSEILKA